MSSSNFRITTHVVPGQHIREYPRALVHDQEEVLHVVVKQYVPLDNLEPKRGDVTILGAHANGFPKELYEPLWDDILMGARKAGVGIRGIWIADVAHQGASGVLNEGKLGNDPSWFDHPRDLLQIVNHFRHLMPRPIIGVGHSFGGANLVNVAYIHPRLFETLILIDPVVQRVASAKGNYLPAQLSTYRRDLWSSREAAAAAFKRSKFYQAWDQRVLDCFIEHGLREMPTLIYADVSQADIPPPTPSSPSVDKMSVISSAAAGANVEISKPVTLTTTKHQEVFTFLRPNYHLYPTSSVPLASPSSALPPNSQSKEPPANPTASARTLPSSSVLPTPPTPLTARLTHPDLPPTNSPNYPFYRPEPILTFNNLPSLRPSVLYIFGETSPLSTPELRRDKLTHTGTGIGGSGGVAEGRVKEVVVENTGHLVPMERPGETAKEVVEWLTGELGRWAWVEERERREWREREGLGPREKAMVGKTWVETIGNPFEKGNPERKGGGKGMGDAKL